MEPQEKKNFFIAFIFPFAFVLLLWAIKGVELYFELDFSKWGVLPRTSEGLLGVFFAPLIHGDLNHLFNNSVPLLVLGWALFYFYKSLAFRVFFLSYFLSGLYTWISARMNYHIGASGVVYALFGFLFISGFIRKYVPLISISFLVAFLYGSLVWGILPLDKSISWEGHFWGLFIGLVMAFYYRKRGPQRKKYSWELEQEDTPQEQKGEGKSITDDSIEYIYHFVPKEEEKG